MKKLILALALQSSFAFAEDKAPATAPATANAAAIEMHEKMAATHQKFADCLKAGKAVEDCQKTAMESCPMKDSEESCPFHGTGMMHGKMGKAGKAKGK
jgi:hypothetical protein